jgi:hypothetical protein
MMKFIDFESLHDVDISSKLCRIASNWSETGLLSFKSTDQLVCEF